MCIPHDNINPNNIHNKSPYFLLKWIFVFLKEFNTFNIPYEKNKPPATPFIDISCFKNELKNTPKGVDIV